MNGLASAFLPTMLVGCALLACSVALRRVSARRQAPQLVPPWLAALAALCVALLAPYGIIAVDESTWRTSDDFMPTINRAHPDLRVFVAWTVIALLLLVPWSIAWLVARPADLATPRCRRCRHIAQATQACCPECGADATAPDALVTGTRLTRFFARHRFASRLLRPASSVVVLLGFAALGLAVIPTWREVHVSPIPVTRNERPATQYLELVASVQLVAVGSATPLFISPVPAPDAFIRTRVVSIDATATAPQVRTVHEALALPGSECVHRFEHEIRSTRDIRSLGDALRAQPLAGILARHNLARSIERRASLFTAGQFGLPFDPDGAVDRAAVFERFGTTIQSLHAPRTTTLAIPASIGALAAIIIVWPHRGPRRAPETARREP